MQELAREAVDRLHQKRLTLGTVESATGGLIAHLITGVPGCSEVFKGSIVSYSNEVKMRVVGVSAESLRRYGAVSEQVVEEMARGGRRLLEVDICIADTGIAGPGGGTVEKPLGLFYLGLAHAGGVLTSRHVFSGTRDENRVSAASEALRWLGEWLGSS